MTYIRHTQLGDFGWISQVIGGVTQVSQTIANVVIGKEKLKTERRLTEKEIQHRAMLAVMGKDFSEKELASKMAISKRRDSLFRDLALYVGLGVGAIVILTSMGTILIKKKGGT